MYIMLKFKQLNRFLIHVVLKETHFLDFIFLFDPSNRRNVKDVLKRFSLADSFLYSYIYPKNITPQSLVLWNVKKQPETINMFYLTSISYNNVTTHKRQTNLPRNYTKLFSIQYTGTVILVNSCPATPPPPSGSTCIAIT